MIHQLFIISALAFLSISVTLYLFISWWYSHGSPSAKRMRRRIARINASSNHDPLEVASDGLIVNSKELDKNKIINSFLLRIPKIFALDDFLRSAKSKLSVWQFILISFICFFVIAVLAIITHNTLLLIASPIAASLPWLIIEKIKQKRLKKFNEQLPDALESLVRGLKAGLSVIGAIQVVGQEYPAPIGEEFTQLYDEIIFGSSPNAALLSMMRRVDSRDLRFMVIALSIQREVGGNLAELLMKISTLMRQRKKLLDKVKTLSADSRLSAWVLGLLPFMVSLIMLITNKEYIQTLWTTSIGQILLIISATLLSVGIIWIKRQINKGI